MESRSSSSYLGKCDVILNQTICIMKEWTRNGLLVTSETPTEGRQHPLSQEGESPPIHQNRPQTIPTVRRCSTRTGHSSVSIAAKRKSGLRSSNSGGTKSPRGRFIPVRFAAVHAGGKAERNTRTIHQQIAMPLASQQLACINALRNNHPPPRRALRRSRNSEKVAVDCDVVQELAGMTEAEFTTRRLIMPGDEVIQHCLSWGHAALTRVVNS